MTCQHLASDAVQEICFYPEHLLSKAVIIYLICINTNGAAAMLAHDNV